MRQWFQILKNLRYWLQSLWACCEILLTVVSSIITSAYVFIYNKRSSDSDRESLISQPIISLFRTLKFSVDHSPILVLASFLVCGLSVSSFTYRHPERRGIFVLVVVAACCVAFYLNISARLILAVVIPWAVSITMVCSILYHWVLHHWRLRWCGWKFEELKGVGEVSI
ncbi:hypothetical protein F5884DRAFT_808559 [Xylogone sp. PMI_703]|nr:hypothetical protein F5884DRAFT_808559 [Xylogone sp. PMI_703]